MIIKLLKIFGYTWLALAVVVIIVSVILLFIEKGYYDALRVLNPHNIYNYIVTIIILSPGIGALMLAERIEMTQEKQVGLLFSHNGEHPYQIEVRQEEQFLMVPEYSEEGLQKMMESPAYQSLDQKNQDYLLRSYQRNILVQPQNL